MLRHQGRVYRSTQTFSDPGWPDVRGGVRDRRWGLDGQRVCVCARGAGGRALAALRGGRMMGAG